MVRKALVVVALLGIVLAATWMTTTNVAQDDATPEATEPAASDCIASESWVTDPNPPAEVPNDGGQNPCDFNQFSWEWFIALMQNVEVDVDGTTITERAFQDETNYPLFIKKTTASCDATGINGEPFVRVVKDDDDTSEDFILPARIPQAGTTKAIYDQNGNVVFYEIRFSRNMCSLDPSTITRFPGGSIELKMAWRVIDEAEKDDYVWMNADIIYGQPNPDTASATEEATAEPTTTLLGLVGFHLVIATELHPEFIWATFEHNMNVPDCNTSSDAGGWSFTSQECVNALVNASSSGVDQCSFNTGMDYQHHGGPTNATGTATEICRVFADGSDGTDDNTASINALNSQLAPIFAAQDNELTVLQNYELVGGLWLTQDAKTSAADNQRGSLELANSTMETTDQGTVSVVNGAVTVTLEGHNNCFACHHYTEGTIDKLSHIFSEINGTPAPTPATTEESSGD